MILKTDLPVYDANGQEIHIGDRIMQGMRPADVHGWDEVIVVEAEESNELLLGEDPTTGEREELQADPMLRGLIHCPHSVKP